MGFLSQKIKFSCLPYCSDAVIHAQFGEDMTDMAFDRIDGNDQLLGNFLVGCPTLQQAQNLSFSLTQWLW